MGRGTQRTLLAACLFIAIALQDAIPAVASIEDMESWRKEFPGTPIPTTLMNIASSINDSANIGLLKGGLHRKSSLQRYSPRLCENANALCGEKATAYFTHLSSCVFPYVRGPIPASRHSHPDVPCFFREKEVALGARVKLPKSRTVDERRFLPRALASRLPFHSGMLGKLLAMLNIPADSNAAAQMAQSLQLCESPAMNNEAKICATSMAALIEFAASLLGPNVTFLGPTSENKSLNATITKISSGNEYTMSGESVACHEVAFPFRVYFCHALKNTKVVQTELDAGDGKVMKGVAVCHRDTTGWDPSHPVFAELGTVPGQGEACHWIFSPTSFLWLSA